MMIEGKFITTDNDMSDINNIRRKVFLDEQGIEKDIIFDNLDDKALNVVIYENDTNKKQPVAVGRIIIETDHALISHVAVLKEFRGKGYGDLVIRMLVNKAFDKNMPATYVNSPKSCKGFFEKIGFIEIDEKNKVNNEYQMMAIYKGKDIRNCMK